MLNPLKFIESNISRWVVFAITPPLLVASGVSSLWLAKHFPGLKLDPAATASFVATAVGGLAYVIVKWVEGAHITLKSAFELVAQQESQRHFERTSPDLHAPPSASPFVQADKAVSPPDDPNPIH